jgi:peptidoglycan hydrolase-like protein with peptidoglycan-binding domain
MNWKANISVVAGLAVAGALAPMPSHAFLDNLKRSLTTCPPNSTAPGCQNQPRQPQRAAPSQAQIALREERRAIQGALNSFGFDVGTPDGLFGPRTRGAISAYQGVIGAPDTGELTPDQQRILLDTEAAMQAGVVPGQDAIMAQQGPQGVLRAAVDPAFAAQFAPQQPGQGGAQPLTAGLAPLPGLTPAQPLVPGGALAPLPGLTPVTPEGGSVMPLPGLAPLPQLAPANGGAQIAGLAPLAPLAPLPLLVPQARAASASERCAQVEESAMQNGGTPQPDQVLSEQFCVARSEAMIGGRAQIAAFGLSDESVTSVCALIKATYGTRLATVPFGPPEQVAAMAQELSTEAGLTDAVTAQGYGRMCLALAYEQDDAPLAITSALVMVAAEEAPYGEIVAHHLREGLGLPATAGTANRWYDASMGALEAGAVPAFAPESSAMRVAIIRAAVGQGGS